MTRFQVVVPTGHPDNTACPRPRYTAGQIDNTINIVYVI